MPKLFIEDLPITGKRVLVRVDFNVPLDSQGHVVDATRIEAALPTIRYILSKQGKLILMSHLGRPHHANQPELSLKPVADKLASLLNHPVKLAPNCIGKEVEGCVSSLQPGDILLLENLRFHRAEEHPDEDLNFAKELASLGDLYVNDAFGTAHRKHSSTYTITSYFPNRAAAGYLLEKEIHFLGHLLKNPQRPFYALIGGAKISTKMGMIDSLLKRVDCLLIGGGMSYTFLQAKGITIGDSLIEQEFLEQAASLLDKYKEKIVLPIDCIAATACTEGVYAKKFSLVGAGIAKGYKGLDIGPQTLELFKRRLSNGQTILWNGPFGVYEIDQFAQGTRALIRFIAQMNAVKIIGGGDLIAAAQKAGVIEHMTHVSTGGGATLEYIRDGTLPAIEALSQGTSGKKFPSLSVGRGGV